MKLKWRKLSFGIVFVALFAMALPGCVVRAGGSVNAGWADERPPEPRVVRVRSRPGHIWVSGRWRWQRGRWVWKGGHHVRVRSGFNWVQGSWAASGNRWRWTAGHWARGGGPREVDHRRGGGDYNGGNEVDHRGGGNEVDHRDTGGGDYPTQAPPAATYKTPDPRRGYVWARGHYRWGGGQYEWVPGHWERSRAKKVWTPGHWEQRGNRYVWIPGAWGRR